MGDMCNQERKRSSKKIGRSKKALKRWEVLVSARSPLGIISYWFTKLCRPFRKQMQITGRYHFRPLACRRPVFQDPIVVVDSPLSSSQDYPEECMYPPGTEPNQHSSALLEKLNQDPTVVMDSPPGFEGNRHDAASFYSEPWRRSFSDQLGMPRNPGGISLQSCPTSAVISHHSTERLGYLVDIGCSSSLQSPQFQTRLESSFKNSGSHESGAPDNHKRKIEDIMSNQGLALDVKIRFVQGLWDQSQAFRSHQSHLEILNLKRECKALSDSKATFLKHFQDLTEKRVEEQRRTAERFAIQNRKLEGAREELSRHLEKYGKPEYIASLDEDIQQKHDEILVLDEEVRSLNSTVANLQTSHKHAKSANREGHAQQNAVSGSYVDENATRILLDNALSSAKGALKIFQKALTDAIKAKGDIASTIDLFQPDTYFARVSHVSYAAKAVLHGIFFEGFENESFNTCSGVSRFLDPDCRQAEFFKYFLRQKGQNGTGDIGDPHFESFCKLKVPRLWEEFNLRKESSNPSMKVACLEALGGPKVLSSFRAAAKEVWLLHKLAFSFEPPASIFRVEQGAAVDTNYMAPVVSLEDSSRFINEVSFMISPGFRLRKTIFRSEVYLSSSIDVVNLES